MARSFVRVGSQYLEYAGAVVTAYPFTLACWCVVDDLTNNHCLMGLADHTGGANNNWRLEARGGVAGDPISAASGTNNASTTTGYSSGVWQHACGVFAGATDRRVFLNGGSKGTNSTNHTPLTPTRTALGRSPSSAPDRYLDGDLAHVGIWSVALTDEEVAVLAAGICPLLVRPTSLVAYWPLSGVWSPEVDVVGRQEMAVTGPSDTPGPGMRMPGRSWAGAPTAAVGGMVWDVLRLAGDAGRFDWRGVRA